MMAKRRISSAFLPTATKANFTGILQSLSNFEKYDLAYSSNEIMYAKPYFFAHANTGYYVMSHLRR